MKQVKKKNRSHRHIPKFKKYYRYNMQDENGVKYISLLQLTYSKIADEVFKTKRKITGDWIIEMNGITLYLDPLWGAQAEITGTSNLSILKRLRLHIMFLNLIKSGKSIVGALEACLLI